MQSASRAIPVSMPLAQSLLERAEALQAQAAELAEVIARDDSTPVPGASRGNAALARDIISARNQRARFLPQSLFAEPAWDILLRLYAAELAQQRITVTQACAASEVPATTGLRWLNTLELNDLVRRQPDPLDGRRIFVSLTAAGEQSMALYFDSIGGMLNAA